jgi:hypothetical protein
VIGKIRLFVGTLIVLLALAPAVVRATRVVDHSSRPSIALSFKKSFDEPPHAAEVPSDLAVSPVVVVVAYPIAAPVSRRTNTSSARAVEALRGPPARPRS